MRHLTRKGESQKITTSVSHVARLAGSDTVRKKWAESAGGCAPTCLQMRAPECFVTEHRFELGFRRGESEPKRHASDGKLTE